MKKRIKVILLLMAFCTLNVFAQEVSFKVSAPETVMIGEQFRVTYTVNQEGTNFKGLQSIKNFDILYGPSVSSSFSSSTSGDKTTTETAISYSYVLKANKEGAYMLPSVSIKVKSKIYNSDEAKIKVVAQRMKEPVDNDSSENAYRNESPTEENAINNKDIFVRTLVSKTKLRESESVYITYRLYTKLQVAGINRIDVPRIAGLDTKEVPSWNDQMQAENYNGQDYYTLNLKTYCITPDKKGNYVIPEGKIQITFQMPTGVQTFFGPQVENVTKNFTTQVTKISVNPLPKPIPDNFSGGIGSLTIRTTLSSTNVKEGENIRMRILVSGEGSLDQLKTPKIDFPESFAVYEPDISQQINFSKNQPTVNKIIDIVFSPSKAGEYKIPSASIVYFDTESNAYKTLSTKEFTIKVDKNPNKKADGVFVMNLKPNACRQFLAKEGIDTLG